MKASEIVDKLKSVLLFDEYDLDGFFFSSKCTTKVFLCVIKIYSSSVF